MVRLLKNMWIAELLCISSIRMLHSSASISSFAYSVLSAFPLLHSPSAPSPARFTRFLCLRAVVSTTVSVLQASIDVLTQEIADLKVKITENQEAVALMNTEIEEETAERQVLPSNCF